MANGPDVRINVRADDNTSAAIASAKRNLGDLAQSAEKSGKLIDKAFKLFAGFSILNGARKAISEVISATESATGSTSAFSKEMDALRSNFSTLLVPGKGLPGVVSSLRELNTAISDPGVRAAADGLFSGIVKGAATLVSWLAQAIKGVRDLGVEFGLVAAQSKNDVEKRLQSQINDLQRSKSFVAMSPGAASAIDAQIAQLEARLQNIKNDVVKGPGSRSPQFNVDSGASASDKATAALLKEQAEARKKFEAARIADREKARMERAQNIADANREAQSYFADLERRALVADKELGETTKKEFDYYFDRIAENSDKTLDKMTVFAEQGARNMQDALAQFFFNPFEGGLKGLLRSFINTMRQMAAQAAASKIFDMLGLGSGGGGGGAGGIAKFFSGLFGFASGGSFKVGGSGGTDSQLVAFKASPDETVSITKPGQRSGGGPVFHVTNAPTINGTGLSAPEVLAILQRSNRDMVERLQQSFARSNMRGPVFV